MEGDDAKTLATAASIEISAIDMYLSFVDVQQNRDSASADEFPDQRILKPVDGGLFLF